MITAEIERIDPSRPAPDFSDDCAQVGSRTDLITTDALIEGVHFDLDRDTLEQIGVQAAVANLSDLAASGARAGWLLWSLCLPARWSPDDVAALTHGFARTAAQHGALVLGGNLAHTPGPAIIAVTAGGELVGTRPMTRSGAQPDDGIFVTGNLGDAALGVVEPDADARAARHRWRPHLAEAALLAVSLGVTAAMDVSDGLLIDADRLALASGVGLEICGGSVPTSALYQSRRGDDKWLALTGGEDYVLLFTARGDPPLAATKVGRCVPGSGLRLDGRPVDPRGYDHFAQPPPGRARSDLGADTLSGAGATVRPAPTVT